MLRCAACGCSKVTALIAGRPYCSSCASKILHTHLIKMLLQMRKEGLITSRVNIEELIERDC